MIGLPAREVSLQGVPVELADKELDLLVCLASAPRIVMSRRKLLQSVWHDASGWASQSTVTENVYRLRNKIHETALDPYGARRRLPVRAMPGELAHRFRDTMAAFPSGVTIMTIADRAGRPWGFTASSFCSLSLDPPLVLVCLAKTAMCHPAFQ